MPAETPTPHRGGPTYFSSPCAVSTRRSLVVVTGCWLPYFWLEDQREVRALFRGSWLEIQESEGPKPCQESPRRLFAMLEWTSHFRQRRKHRCPPLLSVSPGKSWAGLIGGSSHPFLYLSASLRKTGTLAWGRHLQFSRESYFRLSGENMKTLRRTHGIHEPRTQTVPQNPPCL